MEAPAAEPPRHRRDGLLAAGLTIGAGLAGWAAHPPVGVWWLVVLVVPMLLAALDRTATAVGAARPGRARLVGFTVGALTFTPMLVWLIAPAGVAAWLLLSAVMAAWWMLIAHLLRHRLRGPWVVLLAPVVVTGVESWRGRVPMRGFGWGSIAYPHVEGSPLLPLARVVGESGLVFVTALIGALGWYAFVRLRAHRGAGRGWAPGRLRPAAPPAVAIVVIVGASALLAPAPPATAGRTLDLLAVQGNDLLDFDGTRTDERLIITSQMLERTRAALDADGPADLVIWPESSVDRDPFRPSGQHLRPFVEEAAALAGGDLLAGMILDGPRPSEQFVNAGVVVAPGLEVRDRYVKRQVVPFGEYVPFRSLLGDLGPFQQVPRDAVPDGGPTTVRAAGADLAVVICFETSFTEVVRENVRAAADGDAELLVAITNDASFGQSSESAQHVAQSRLRAVETGRWAVHAALSGGSALIDPAGGVHAATGLFEQATIRADVPLVEGTTPYLVLGDVVGLLSRWAVVALVVLDLLRRGWLLRTSTPARSDRRARGSAAD